MPSARRPNPPATRALILTRRPGFGWVTGLPADATRAQRQFMLMYPPIVERIRSGRTLRYNRSGLDELFRAHRGRRDPSVEDELRANFDCQRDAVLREFMIDWEKHFPGVLHPPLHAADALRVEEIPRGVPVKIFACEGLEEAVRFDGEWL